MFWHSDGPPSSNSLGIIQKRILLALKCEISVFPNFMRRLRQEKVLSLLNHAGFVYIGKLSFNTMQDCWWRVPFRFDE